MDNEIRFIDTHTHILPGMDDGAANLFEAEAMIQALVQQSVREVWLSPHYYAHKEALASFLARRQASYDALLPVLQKYPIRWRLGAEVYLTGALFNLKDLQPLFMSGSDYLLLEIPFDASSVEHISEQIARLIDNHEVEIVLAHIDRYDFMYKKTALERFLDLGVDLQCDLAFMDSSWLKRRTIFKYIEEGLIQHFCTDCHNMSSRAPQVTVKLDKMSEKLSKNSFAHYFKTAD